MLGVSLGTKESKLFWGSCASKDKHSINHETNKIISGAEKFQTEGSENIKLLGQKQIWLGWARNPEWQKESKRGGGLGEVRLASRGGLVMGDLGLCPKSDRRIILSIKVIQADLCLKVINPASA